MGISLIESMIAITTLSVIASVSYLAVTNVGSMSRNTRFERDVITLNAAVRTYIATGGNLSMAKSDAEVIARLKQSLSSEDRETQVGSGGSLIDGRLKPVFVKANQSKGRPRAAWNSGLQRFVILGDDKAGFSGFDIDDIPEESTGYDSHRRSSFAFDKPGGWIWAVAPERIQERVELTQITPDQSYGGPGGFTASSPDRLQLTPPTFSHALSRSPLTTFPLQVTITDTNPAGTSKAITAVNTDPLAQNLTNTVTLNPGDSLHGIAVSLDPDHWLDSAYVSKTFDASPYPLSLSIDTPQSSVTYVEVGGEMIGAFPMDPSGVSPTLLLDNVIGQISTRYTNNKAFQIRWVTGDSDPTTDPAANELPAFKRTVPTPKVDVSLPVWDGGTSLRIRAAGVAINTEQYSSSPVAETTIAASPLSLPAPVVSRSDEGLVSITLDTSAGDVPVGYRIFYTTDGTDPGEGSAVAELYEGEFELPREVCSATEISARAFGPAAYPGWFSPSEGTSFKASPLADTSAAAAFICRYSTSQLCDYTWLIFDTGSDEAKIEDNHAVIVGNIGVGPDAELDADVHGDRNVLDTIHADPTAKVENGSAAEIRDLSGLETTALSLVAEASALTPTQSFGFLDKSKTIYGTDPDGMNVIKIDKVEMKENDTLELTGDVDDYFIILVKDKFKVEKTGKLQVTGGVDPSNVLIVATSDHEVKFKLKNGTITASVLAPLSKVELAEAGVYSGHFIGGPKSKVKDEAILSAETKFGGCTASPITVPVIPPPAPPAPPADPIIVILADEEFIDNGTSTVAAYAGNVGAEAAYATNEDITTETGNPWLRLSSEFAGGEVLLPTGQSGDQGLFATTASLPFTLAEITAGSVAQTSLDDVAGVEPIDPYSYNCLVGKQVVAVVHKSEITQGSVGGTTNLKGERRGLFAFTVLGIEPAGTIAETGSPDSSPALRVRIDPPADLSNLERFYCDSTPEPPGPGIAGGHFDLDTSSFIAPFNSGKTDKHVHEYDDKYDVTGADFFNLEKCHNITEDVPTGTKFKIIISNPDLSPGGRLVINQTYSPYTAASWKSVQEYANIPIADLPVYTHTSAASGTALLTQLGLYFDVGAIAAGQIVPTNTGDVRKNVPGKYGEWRNGALTIQAVEVNGDGTDAFTTSTEISAGGVQGAATSGLLWEATIFWHWHGDSYHEWGNPHQPVPYEP